MRNQQGIVVTLIVFIVLTLILGTTTYFGFKGMSEKAAALKQTTDELDSAKKSNSSLNGSLTNIKKTLGYPNADDADVASQMESDIAGILGDGGGNPTYKEAVAQLVQKLKLSDETKTKAEADRDRAVADAEAETKRAADQKTEFDAQIAQLKTQHAEELAAAKASSEKLQDDFDAQTKGFVNLQSETKRALETKNEEVANLKEDVEALADVNVELASQIDQYNKAEFATPDAEVLFVDLTNGLVRLNIGSKDGVRPQTKFNIFQRDALDVGDVKAKAVVEIVRSLDEHLCEAKIRQDEMNDPITAGDLAYTPLWRRGDKIKYALDFWLDLDKDGKSDLDRVRNLIEAAGGEVVAYLDDNGVLQGKVTPDVFRFVASDRQLVDLLPELANFDDASKAELQKNEQKYLESVKLNGVKSMALADFLERVGYKETGQVSHYQGDVRISNVENGLSPSQKSPGTVAPIYQNPDGTPRVSPGAVSPTYSNPEGTAPTSPGVVSPVYTDEGNPPQVSPGKVSDQYFRKRTPKSPRD